MLVNEELSAGTYYLVIDGGGYEDVGDDGYSDYSSLGHYTISGQTGVTASVDVPRVLSASIESGDILDGLRSVRFEFSHDVSASLDISDLWLLNSTTIQLVPVGGAEIAWIEEEQVAVWDFSTLEIPLGAYSVALLGAGVTNEAGQPLDGDGNGEPGGDWIRELTVTIGGDVDLDYNVDFADFLILSTNFGRPGGWSDGDFTRDGEVNFADFLILSHNFGATDAP